MRRSIPTFPGWTEPRVIPPAGRPARRRLAADLAVDDLADEVGVAVVPGVLLDHVEVDPAEREGVARRPGPDLVQTAAGGRPATRLALPLPDGEVGLPVGSVEGGEVGVVVLGRE